MQTAKLPFLALFISENIGVLFLHAYIRSINMCWASQFAGFWTYSANKTDMVPATRTLPLPISLILFYFLFFPQYFSYMSTLLCLEFKLLECLECKLDNDREHCLFSSTSICQMWVSEWMNDFIQLSFEFSSQSFKTMKLKNVHSLRPRF